MQLCFIPIAQFVMYTALKKKNQNKKPQNPYQTKNHLII